MFPILVVARVHDFFSRAFCRQEAEGKPPLVSLLVYLRGRRTKAFLCEHSRAPNSSPFRARVCRASIKVLFYVPSRRQRILFFALLLPARVNGSKTPADFHNSEGDESLSGTSLLSGILLRAGISSLRSTACVCVCVCRQKDVRVWRRTVFRF